MKCASYDVAVISSEVDAVRQLLSTARDPASRIQELEFRDVRYRSIDMLWEHEAVCSTHTIPTIHTALRYRQQVSICAHLVI